MLPCPWCLQQCPQPQTSGSCKEATTQGASTTCEAEESRARGSICTTGLFPDQTEGKGANLRNVEK